jgi:hypothetical protein
VLDKWGVMIGLDPTWLSARSILEMVMKPSPQEGAVIVQLDYVKGNACDVSLSLSVNRFAGHLIDLILNSDWIISVALSATGRLLAAESRPDMTAQRNSGLFTSPRD